MCKQLRKRKMCTNPKLFSCTQKVHTCTAASTQNERDSGKSP